MSELHERGISCGGCAGECCTAKSNSMMIDSTEAQRIVGYLSGANRLTLKLRSRLETCVREFRLDVELPQFGSRRNLRRTYTCPFYSTGPNGCSLPTEVKPLGCLAFNPTRPRATDLKSGQCQVYDFGQTLRPEAPETHGKLPIPLAVLRHLNSP